MTKISRAPNAKGEGSLLREEIVLAAQRILLRTGDNNAITLRGVAREAGITAPAIYAHFPETHAIIEEVVQRNFTEFMRQLRLAANGVPEPLGRLIAAAEAYVAFAEQKPAAYRVMFGRSRLSGEVVVSKSVDNIYGAEAFGFLMSRVQDCLDGGAAPAFEVATAIWVALHGYADLQATHPGFPWPPRGPLIKAIIEHQLAIPPAFTAEQRTL